MAELPLSVESATDSVPELSIPPRYRRRWG